MKRDCATCKRGHWTLDELCCDADTGWKAVHVSNPYMIGVYTDSSLITAFLVILNEVSEAVLAVLLRQDTMGLESLAGSLVFDAFLQGGTAVVTRFAVSRVFHQPGALLSSGGWRHFALLFIVWLVSASVNLLPGRTGIYVYAALYLVFVGATYALVRKYMPKWREAPAFFAWWAVGASLLHASVFTSWHRVANDYYQIWPLQIAYALASLIVALHREKTERGTRIVACVLFGFVTAWLALLNVLVLDRARGISAAGWAAVVVGLATILELILVLMTGVVSPVVEDNEDVQLRRK